MPETPAKPKRTMLWVALGVAVIMIGLLCWWLWPEPPVEAVELSAAEVTALEAKLDALEQPGPVYEKGNKEIRITERELNGLLHHNTQLGDTVRLELARNAIHARVEVDLDPDLPLFGGKRFKARARFLLNKPDGKTALILDDVTVWGISLPNDWLGQLKSRDLLGEAIGPGNRGFPGVESFEVRRGELVIHLKE